MINNHIFIVFGVEHYNTLGVIRSLGEKGISPIYIAIKNKARVASTSKYISQCYYVDSVEEGYDVLITNYGNSKSNSLYGKPFVLCIDDKTISYLDYRYNSIKNSFILFNAGIPGRINEYMNKSRILECAKKNGLDVLKTWVCGKNSIPNNVEYPVITKSISPVIGGWKSDVYICRSKTELENAFKKIQAPKVMLQKYIDKKNEYCIEGFCINHGKECVFATANSYHYNIDGFYSPYMRVDNMDNSYLKKTLSLMLEEIGFEGIFEIEFIVDKNDRLYFSEINFRNSTWSYGATVAGVNMPYMWCESMLNGKIPNEVINNRIKEPFDAMVEPIDYQKRVVERGYDYKEWIIDAICCKCHYYYDKNDLQPFYEMIRNNEKLR